MATSNSPNGRLDPGVAAALAVLPPPPFDLTSARLSDIPQMRELLGTAASPTEPAAGALLVTDYLIDGPSSDPLLMRVRRPSSGRTGLPCIYWIHGGGYIFGSVLEADPRLDRWVEQLEVVVVSVEYRLAPETPFPGPLEDCYTGIVWVQATADELGVDRRRIAIAGASAGGGLGAGLALLARDRGLVSPCYQLLIYPMIDDRGLTTSSQKEVPIWDYSANRLGWRAYLGCEPGAPDIPAYAAAARATDLRGLPPTFICVGTEDIFQDEDLDYGRRLLAHNVPTELHVYPGAPHAFEVLAPAAELSLSCQKAIDQALARALDLR
jgi:acetyl esterase/lipase